MEGTWEWKRDLAWRLYAPDGRWAGYVVGRLWRAITPEGNWSGDTGTETTPQRAREACEATARRIWEQGT
ncbi:MAG: hypothetical protein EKK55_08480 [Rhodocyclaceae bacterium]|nr:MAG: hypothetical protein EKK55_08480 [Rhodocyclaceae bacterium]